MQMPIPIMGIFLHCNRFFCSILHQHRSKKNYFSLFGSLTRQVHNKMKAWLPTSDEPILWKYSIYWHAANFPEKQYNREFLLQWILFMACTWSWKQNKISATCNIWVWPLQEKVSKWRDSNLINVLYYKAYGIILIANVKTGVGIKKNILKKTPIHTHTPPEQKRSGKRTEFSTDLIG